MVTASCCTRCWLRVFWPRPHARPFRISSPRTRVLSLPNYGSLTSHFNSWLWTGGGGAQTVEPVKKGPKQMSQAKNPSLNGGLVATGTGLTEHSLSISRIYSLESEDSRWESSSIHLLDIHILWWLACLFSGMHCTCETYRGSEAYSGSRGVRGDELSKKPRWTRNP